MISGKIICFEHFCSVLYEFFSISMYGFLLLEVVTVSCDILKKKSAVTSLKQKHIGFSKEVGRISALAQNNMSFLQLFKKP